MNESFNRKYVGALCLAAILILGLGAWFRPEKPHPPPPSPSETASLQRIVQRENLRNTSTYLAGHAAGLSSYVAYVPEFANSGVYWSSPETILVPRSASTDPTEPVLRVVKFGGGTSAAYTLSTDSGGGRWIVLIGRGADRQPVWTSALQGGTVPAICDGIPYRELVVGVPLNSSMGGFAAFDLDGKLAGVVVPCGGSMHVMSAESIAPLLSTLESPGNRIWQRLGLRMDPVENGLFVAEAWKGGLGYHAGLRAGDLLVTANQTPVPNVSALWAQVDTNQAPGIAVQRGARRIEVDLRASETAAGAALLQPALAVDPGSAADRAGLRTGDRVIQAGGISNPSTTQLRRFLEDSASKNPLLVFERGERQFAKTVAR